ncbi:MAG: hypothetical protein IJ228_11860 [Succinivibrio sp.]|nr:hypothetical protein [Succinivibrio sp.]
MSKFHLGALSAALIMLGYSATTLAVLPDEAFAIDGIRPGVPLEQVRSSQELEQLKHDKFRTGKGLIIECDDDTSELIIEELKARSPELLTPAGVGVGMPATVLKERYGAPDRLEHDHHSIEHKYRNQNRTLKLEFKVRDGIIEAVECQYDAD